MKLFVCCCLGVGLCKVDPTIGEDLQSTLYFATANKMTGQLRGNNITTGDLFNPFPLGVGSPKARGERSTSWRSTSFSLCSLKASVESSHNTAAMNLMESWSISCYGMKGPRPQGQKISQLLEVFVFNQCLLCYYFQH